MSYEPTEWKAGDTITSAKLNKMEQGIAAGGTGGGGNVLVVTENDGVLDATWKEIVDAAHTNGVVLELENEHGYINVFSLTEYGMDAESGAYIMTFFSFNGANYIHYYYAESENDYPINDD